MREHSRATIDRYAIRTPAPDAPAGNLSGGNIQRLILAPGLRPGTSGARAAEPHPRAWTCARPRFVYDRVQDARDRGCAVVLISEDLDELSLLADRMVVLYSGEIAGERARGDYDAYALGRLMAGVREDA